MNTLSAMKRDIAERFAATAVDRLSLDEARKVVEEFLLSLARCSMCGGSGEFTFGRDVRFQVVDPFRSQAKEERVIPDGTRTPCPACRGSEGNEAPGDPEFVAWHCLSGDRDDDCHAMKRRADDLGDSHASCGWRIVLPLQPKDGV